MPETNDRHTCSGAGGPDETKDCARCAALLPKRNPGTHWTRPAGVHLEVPLTNRTLTNIRNWGRTIT